MKTEKQKHYAMETKC